MNAGCSYLPEVPEAEAQGTVGELYQDIRAVLGLPLVNLVYRHLAVEPGRLEQAWRELRPNLTDAAVDEGAEELVGLARLDGLTISAAALGAAGVAPADLAAIATTFDAYNHANPRNLIALLALERGAEGTGGSRPASRPAGPPDLLPMADLARLDPAIVALLHEMAGPFAARGETTLIPGLLRHFAGKPAMLAIFWTTIEPLARGRSLARRANLVVQRAAALAEALPHPVKATTDPATLAVLDRFTWTIPRMIVTGVTLRQALPDTLAGASSID
jgi:hypothetical protein